jgi:hypothetical protein
VWLAKPGEPFAAHGPAAAFFKEHPELGAMRFDGRPKAGYFCPTWLLSPAGADVRRLMNDDLVELVSRDGYTAVNWDIEQTVIGAAAGNDPDRGFCVCPRCLAAFRRDHKVGDAEKLDAAVLRGKYREAWVDFRCQQNADLVADVRKSLKSCARPVEFSVYSGYQSQQTREWYGVDWQRLGPHIDLAVAGYGGPRKSLQATRAALGPTPLIGGEMYYLSPEPPTAIAEWMKGSLTQAPRPEYWRNRLLRQFADGGCQGVLIWYLPTMDGGAFYYTSEAAQLIAAHEEFFCQGRRCDESFQVTGLRPEHWAAFEHHGRRLLMLLSFSDKETAVDVGQPRLQGRWQAEIDQQKSPATIDPARFSVRLEPRAAKVLVFSKR